MKLRKNSDIEILEILIRYQGQLCVFIPYNIQPFYIKIVCRVLDFAFGMNKKKWLYSKSHIVEHNHYV